MYTLMFLILNFIEFFIIYKMTKICINKPAKNRKIEILSYIILYVVNSINYLVFTIPALILIGNIIGIFLITYNYKIKFLLKISYCIFIICLFIMPEIFLYKTSILHITNTTVKNEYTNLFLVAFINLFLGFIYLIVKFILLFKNKKIMINLYLIVITTGCLLFNILILEENTHNIGNLALSSILILCIIPSTIYVYAKFIEYSNERLKIGIIEQQNKYYEQQLLTINKLNKASKSVKHDYKNHMNIIKSLIDNNNIELLKEYVDDICEKIDNLEKINLTENIVVDSILNFKIDKIKENNINYNFNIQIPKDLNINSVDITIIISNLLDNAIEACMRDLKTKNKDICFDLLFKNNLLIIKCKNTFDGIVNKKEGDFLSRKDNNLDCGIGIFNIENVVNKYNGFIKIVYDDKIFNVELSLILEI